MSNCIPEPDMASPTWPFVLAFAKRMEYKLSLNRHKGDRDGWRKASVNNLVHCLEEEMLETYAALLNGVSEEIANECADIANFAMMISDNVLHPV